MGARPSTFRKSGGFLNGVDGVIKGYRFTDEFNGVAFKPGRNAEGKEKFHSLQFEIAVRIDGADEDITQNLFAGGYEDYEVSEDGLTLTSADGGTCSIGANTGAGKFVSSLVAAGFPEANLSDDPNSINLEPIVGTRVRFGQLTEMGKDGKPKLRKATKGKFAGQSFPQTTTVVEQVYDVPAVGKGTKAKGTKASATGTDVTELATDTLIAILEGGGGSIAKAKLKMAVLKKLTGNPQHEAVQKVVGSEKFLGDSELWEYDGTTVTLAA